MANAQELFLIDGRSSGVFFCGECRHTNGDKQGAESCCTCRICGKLVPRATIGKGNYSGIHGECHDSQRYEREAKNLAAAEVVDGWDGFVYLDGAGHQDGYFESVDYLLDWLRGEDIDYEWPERVFCCKKYPIRSVDASDVLEMVFGDMHEDCVESAEGVKELDEALGKFIKANGHLYSWEVDCKRCVMVPARKAGERWAT